MFNLLHSMPAIESSTYTPTGTCGNCLASAYHPLEHTCIECAIDHGLTHDSFTAYTYPSELMYVSLDSTLKRSYFINGRI